MPIKPNAMVADLSTSSVSQKKLNLTTVDWRFKVNSGN